MTGIFKGNWHARLIDRCAIHGILVALLLTVSWEAIAGNTPGASIGAIRWDAWVGDLNTSPVGVPDVGLQVERSLGPHQFHDRLPFYAVETAYNSVNVRQRTQSTMDSDINYANSYGINYWAFVYYPVGSGLDTARNLYQSSTVRGSLKYCFIIDKGFMPPQNFGELISAFQHNHYQKVIGNRPLLYILGGGSQQYTFSELVSLRTMAASAGVANPYVVLMDSDSWRAASTASSILADAISGYVTASSSGGAPYSTLISGDQSLWNTHQSTGRKVVPWVTTGYDTRPRYLNPVSWVTVGPNDWVQTATPGEIGVSLQNAMNWVANNEFAAEANTLLMYAWNEFDEGGWLTPTLRYGSDRLTAVRNALKYGSSSNWDLNQTADKAFDGNFGTNWQAAVGTSFNGQWLEVDFGVDSSFGQVTLSEYGNRTSGFRIEYLNGATWRTAVTGTTIGTSRTLNFAAVIGNKARIYFTTGIYTPIIYEFSINNSPVAPSSNLARYKSYASSSQWDATQSADKAFDGNFGTNWQSALGSGFNGQWLEVSFGKKTAFNTVTLSEYGNRTTGYRIQYWNGAQWVTAYTGTTIGANRTVTFPAVSGSKARIYFTSGSYTPIVYEFQLVMI